MSAAHFLTIFAAGLVAGIINSVAGGGTLLTFPVLVWTGLPPVIANATNTLALFPGSLAGAFALRHEAARVPALLRLLIPAAVLGALVGGWLLLATPGRVFSSIVPGLVLLATCLVAAQRPIALLLGTDRPAAGGPGRSLALFAAQLAVSIYGGYFGAGLGILMLAALGLYGVQDIQARNGVKNILGGITNGVAGIYFAASGGVDWPSALVLCTGAIAGGYAGGRVSRRFPPRLAETIVIAIGALAAVSLALRRGS